MRQLFALFLLMLHGALAAQVTVKGLEYQLDTEPAAGSAAQLQLETTAPVEHSLFLLDKPDRLVLDLKNTKLAWDIPPPASGNPYVRKVRTGVHKGQDLRIVFDLKQPVRPSSRVLRAEDGSQRLFIELVAKAAPVTTLAPILARPPTPSLAPQAPVQTPASISRAQQAPSPEPKKQLQQGRDIIIAIDAGHGGKDPGAIGPGGTKEKDVTLAVARKLAVEINREPGMRGVLVRDKDEFIRLRDRILIARQQGADLFVSIHADAFKDRRVRGSSVFTLSRGGATSEAARWLADRENAADLVGGVTLDDKDDMLASVLLDLSQSATLQAGNEVAGKVLAKLGQIGEVHVGKVQRAGFAVLKAPDIPSLLVETAFISNPEEERHLRSSAHQTKLARSVAEGIRAYFYSSPPMGTRLALRAKREGGRHEVSQGDTLSAIAEQYNVSMDLIRSYNALNSDQLRVGQTLIIPRELM